MKVSVLTLSWEPQFFLLPFPPLPHRKSFACHELKALLPMLNRWQDHFCNLADQSLEVISKIQLSAFGASLIPLASCPEDLCCFSTASCLPETLRPTKPRLCRCSKRLEEKFIPAFLQIFRASGNTKRFVIILSATFWVRKPREIEIKLIRNEAPQWLIVWMGRRILAFLCLKLRSN